MLSEQKQKRLRIWCRKIGADLGQIGILVEDHICQRANKITSAGLKAEIKYLGRYFSSRQIKEMVRGEMKSLRRHRMKSQSKLKPEMNISIGKRKRKM